MPKNSILYRIQAIDEASKTFSKITEKVKSLESATRKIEKAQRSLNDTSAKFRNVSLIAIGGLGIATKMLVGFETQMNTITAVTGNTQEQIKIFRDKAVELGSSTQYTSEEVARLGVSFSRAGYSIEETTGLVADTLQMATAGNISLEQSAELVSKAIKGFGLNIEDATRITDVFTAGANNSAMTIDEFQQMISKTGSVSQLANEDLESMVAMFGLLKDSAMTGEVASTGLGASMMRLSGNLAPVKKAIANLGIDPKKFQTASFTDKLAMLHKNIKKIDLATAQELFGQEHAKTMLTLLANYDKLGLKLEKVKESSGSAKRAQEAMMEGLPGAFNRWTSAIQGVVYGLGNDGLTGKLTLVFNSMTDLINIFTNSKNPMKEFVVNAGLIFGSMILVSMGIQVIVYALGFLKTMIIVIRGLTIAWAFVNALLGLSLSPVLLVLLPIIAGIVLFAAVLYGLYKAYQYIKGLLDDNPDTQKREQAEKMSIIDDLKSKAQKLESQITGSKNNSVSGDINVNVSSSKDLQTQLEIANTENLKLAEQN